MSLSPWRVARIGETGMPEKEGDITKTNNQAWKHLEGRLLEQTRPNWVSAGAQLDLSTDIAYA